MPSTIKGLKAQHTKARRGTLQDQTTAKKTTRVANNAKQTSKATKTKSTAATIRILKPDFEFGAKGTKRNDAWQLAKKTKDAAKYAAAGGPRKYLPRWARAGAIAY